MTISTSRWLAYAGAGAATALTGATSVDAEIHYSGRVDVAFPPDQNKSVALQLEESGNSIFFAHTVNGGSVDFFGAAGLKSGAFAGSYPGFEYAYVWRLKNRDRYVSRAHFTNGGFGFGTSGTMVRGSRSSENWRWSGKGTDFVGFRFNNGAGIQYGWARVRMDGAVQDLVSQSSTMAAPTPESPSKPARQALRRWSVLTKARSGCSPLARLVSLSGGNGGSVFPLETPPRLGDAGFLPRAPKRISAALEERRIP